MSGIGESISMDVMTGQRNTWCITTEKQSGGGMLTLRMAYHPADGDLFGERRPNISFYHVFIHRLMKSNYMSALCCHMVRGL